MRIAAKGAIWRWHGRFSIETEQRAIGLVGVEHAPRAVGDESALRQIIDKSLGDVVAAMALAEIEDADGPCEEAEHADDGEAGKNREDEGLRDLARHHGEADGGDRQCKSEKNHEPHAPIARRQVGGGL